MDKEYEKFLKTWKVSRKRLQEIIDKIIAWQEVSEADLAIQQTYWKQIEAALKAAKKTETPNVTTQDTSWISMDSEEDYKQKIRDSVKKNIENKNIDKKESSFNDNINNTNNKKKTFKELTWRNINEVDEIINKTDDVVDKADEINDLKNINGVNKTVKAINKSEKLKKILDLSKKIPWVSKILPVAKVAWKYAWPIWIALAIWDWLMDVRFDKLNDDEKSRAQMLWTFINDLVWKTVINTAWTTAEFLTVAPAWIWWQAKDLFNEAFWNKEERKKDYSTEAVKAWDSSIGNWLKNTRTKMLNFQDVSTYWKDADNLEEYRRELWLDKEWKNLPKIESEAESMWFWQEDSPTNQAANINQTQKTNKPEKISEQWRKIVKFKDWTYWYVSQWWENKWKLVWGFWSLDEVKKNIQSWVKWYHLWNIKEWVEKSKSQEMAENFLKDYVSKVDLKSKWIGDEDINNLFK